MSIELPEHATKNTQFSVPKILFDSIFQSSVDEFMSKGICKDYDGVSAYCNEWAHSIVVKLKEADGCFMVEGGLHDIVYGYLEHLEGAIGSYLIDIYKNTARNRRIIISRRGLFHHILR